MAFLVVMTIPQQGEIGHGIELAEVGAGDVEKIANHQVGGPGRQQIRQTIKDIKMCRPRSYG